MSEFIGHNSPHTPEVTNQGFPQPAVPQASPAAAQAPASAVHPFKTPEMPQIVNSAVYAKSKDYRSAVSTHGGVMRGDGKTKHNEQSVHSIFTMLGSKPFPGR